MIFFFFFNYTATTEIYTLSLHDALPISKVFQEARAVNAQSFEFELNGFAYHVRANGNGRRTKGTKSRGFNRSEEHTSELQSRQYLVCRLLLEKKKKKN